MSLAAHASAVPCAAGRPARTTVGLATAGMNGTLSTREVCAPPASTSGLQPSASSVAAGRRIRIGIRNDSPDLGQAALALNPEPAFGLGAAAKSIPLPNPEPRALGQPLIVPSIRSRDIACAEWPNIRGFEHFL
jgi:hypothetical protein